MPKALSCSKEEMELSLCTDVYNKLYDVKENIDLVNSLQDTGFDKMLIMQKIFPNDTKESWEIGEAYAQAYAESNLSAIIPWGITRDIKKPGSSLPGADIIGLYRHDSGTYFLFGEIKTSSDKNCPPGVMYGEHGLKNQLEDLSITTLIISKKPGNTGISRDIRTEFTTDLLLSD